MEILTAPTPEALRSAREGMKSVTETRRLSSAEFELREVANGTGGTNLLYSGYACVTGADYGMEDWLGPWTERVAPGAFRRTLAENPDVNFLLNHQGMSLARTKPGTLQLHEDDKGLLSEATLDPVNPMVIALRSAIERGDIDEMSFAFRVMAQEWDGDYSDRTISEVSIHHGDVSAVNFGANPHTAGSVSLRNNEVREATPEQLLEALDGLISRSELDEATLLALDERFASLRSLTIEVAPAMKDDLTIRRARLALLNA